MATMRKHMRFSMLWLHKAGTSLLHKEHEGCSTVSFQRESSLIDPQLEGSFFQFQPEWSGLTYERANTQPLVSAAQWQLLAKGM